MQYVYKYIEFRKIEKLSRTRVKTKQEKKQDKSKKQDKIKNKTNKWQIEFNYFIYIQYKD